MLMRLDEVGENCENLMAKVISDTTHKAEQTRTGQNETAVPMELDYVGGSEPYDEDWDDVAEVRRDRRCYNCGMMGHFARDFRMRGKGKGKAKDEGKGQIKGEGKMEKGAGKKGPGKCGRFKGGRAGEQNDRGYQGQCWTCSKTGHGSSECRWGVDNVDEDDADSQRSWEQPESEKDRGVWIVGNVEELVDEEMMSEWRERRETEEGTARLECR